jgi:peptide/nickel transport system permease protein
MTRCRQRAPVLSYNEVDVATFLIRRLVNYLILILVATTGAYFLAATSLHPRANLAGRNPPPPVAVVDRQLTALNINDKTPVLDRYAIWVKGVAHGDFGRTWDNNSVNAEMGRRMGVSLRLLFVGTVLGSGFGVLVGAYSAIKQYRPSDHAITLVSFLVLSMPVFVLAVMLQIAAVKINKTVGHQVFQYSGETSAGLTGGFWTHLGDRLQHLVLPTLTIVLGQIAIFSRYQRNSMLDVLDSDFVRTALAKGLRRRAALLKHALRTALIPAATFFAYSFGLLLVGATFTEKIFGWHGMGEWLIDSILTNDINAVVAISCFTAVLVLIAGLLSDVAYAVLDPRVRST